MKTRWMNVCATSSARAGTKTKWKKCWRMKTDGPSPGTVCCEAELWTGSLNRRILRKSNTNRRTKTRKSMGKPTTRILPRRKTNPPRKRLRLRSNSTYANLPRNRRGRRGTMHCVTRRQRPPERAYIGYREGETDGRTCTDGCAANKSRRTGIRYLFEAVEGSHRVH